MLIHLVPRMLFPPYQPVPACNLIDFQCPELGLTLKSGKELTARRPYPNKRYLVACRKIGQKAVNGIFIETAGPLREFRTITRWAVGAERVVTHRIRYTVLDDDFDAISESMILWNGMSESLGGWKSRWPSNAERLSPAEAQPRMELFASNRKGTYSDLFEENECFPGTVLSGWIVEREEAFLLPTIERERLTQARRDMSLFERLPSVEHAFRAAI